ncbi:MAG: proline iminopeptidase [Psychrosphaera sp.]|jgi:proline iminopeptidase
MTVFMRPLFPDIQINQSYMVPVSDGHFIYVEESGNPDGIPVVYCHGGPGGGSEHLYRRFYNPEHYRIILFDQRGCGKSTPHCANDINATWNNTLSDLTKDMEVIRQYLNIKRWVVAGGSWGTTVALIYAIEYPSLVLGLILRGVFLGRQQDLDWLYGTKVGASQIYPERHANFIRGKNADSVAELLADYYEQLTGDNDLVQLSAAKQFAHWESSISKLKPSSGSLQMTNKEVIAGSLLACHYFTNNCFMYEHEIISEIGRISHIPGYIIHGRYDIVCKPEGAYELSRFWENGLLEIIPEAGHSCTEIGIIDGLVRASDEMANYIKQEKLS